MCLENDEIKLCNCFHDDLTLLLNDVFMPPEQTVWDILFYFRLSLTSDGPAGDFGFGKHILFSFLCLRIE